MHPTFPLKPLMIGDICIDTPLTLAPMAGQTNHPFRVLCRRMGGCGLVCTELISSTAIQFKSDKTVRRYFDWTAAETPFAVQLFGSDPQVMAEAARVVADLGASIVDINMGCWVPKVAKKGGGAALLKDVCTATAVVDAVVRAVDIPVTVKVRAGWTKDELTAIPFARAAEQCGVKAIAVHGRTAEQGFSGQADWSIIRRVKETVTSIPVIGNGDVKTADDARRMFVETGCDAVMIGRAALGAPWLFHQIAETLRTGITPPAPNAQQRAQLALDHARLAVQIGGSERHSVLELRGQISQYHLGIAGAAQMRQKLVHVETLADIEAILRPFAEQADDAQLDSAYNHELRHLSA
jgi:tRNA-dihydrouridine synthase B